MTLIEQYNECRRKTAVKLTGLKDIKYSPIHGPIPLNLCELAYNNIWSRYYIVICWFYETPYVTIATSLKGIDYN